MSKRINVYYSYAGRLVYLYTTERFNRCKDAVEAFHKQGMQNDELVKSRVVIGIKAPSVVAFFDKGKR